MKLAYAVWQKQYMVLSQLKPIKELTIINRPLHTSFWISVISKLLSVNDHNVVGLCTLNTR